MMHMKGFRDPINQVERVDATALGAKHQIELGSVEWKGEFKIGVELHGGCEYIFKEW